MSGQKLDDNNARGDLKHPQQYASGYHAPVLCNAVVKGLITRREGIYVDGTLGGGGHAQAMLEVLSSEGHLLGLDRDDDALQAAEERLFNEVKTGRLSIVKGDFRDIAKHVKECGFERIDGLLLDLGVSSHQLDEPERGFSHRKEGPLDMRMDTGESEDASEILNSWPESDIVSILKRFGEEPRSRRIARAIVDHRPLSTTTELAEIVRQAVPQNQSNKSLARVFQAVRIAVNRELDALEQALRETVDLLRIGGRIAVISYHSLEDRRVKRFFRSGSFDGIVRRDLYGEKISPITEISGRPVNPSEAELDVNPRARSARLRFAERVATEEANVC